MSATLVKPEKKRYRVGIKSDPGAPFAERFENSVQRGLSGQVRKKPVFPIGVTDHAGVTFHEKVYLPGPDGAPSEVQRGQILAISAEQYADLVKSLQVGELPEGEHAKQLEDAKKFEELNKLPAGSRFVSRHYGWVIQWELIQTSQGRRPEDDVWEWRSQKVWRGSKLYEPCEDPLNEVPLARYLVLHEQRDQDTRLDTVPLEAVGFVEDAESPDAGQVLPGPELEVRGGPSSAKKPKKTGPEDTRS